MSKAELDILEKAFAADVEHAISSGLGLIQTKSRVAKRLCDDGLLAESQVTLPGRIPVVVKRYSITLLGHFAYCTSDRCT